METKASIYAQSVPSNPRRFGNKSVLHTSVTDLILLVLSSANKASSKFMPSSVISSWITAPLSALFPGPGSSNDKIVFSSNPRSKVPVTFIRYSCHCSSVTGAHDVETICNFPFLDLRRSRNPLTLITLSVPPKDCVKLVTGSNGVPSRSVP